MQLFPFQQTAVDFFDIQRSVLCADEMGTGKSYIGTARDLRIRNKFRGKTLVVATMSTLDMWRRMFEAEGLKVRVINPKARELLFKPEVKCEAHGLARRPATPNYQGTQRDSVETAKSADESSLMDETILDPQSTIAMKPIKSEESSVLGVISASAREKSLESVGSTKQKCICPEVFIVHWAALQQRGGHWLTPDLMDVQFMHVIADEVHHAQNRNAQQTIGLKRIKTVFKTGLSGTPVTNTPDKLWSILNWLYPQEFSSYWRFYGKFVDFEIDPAGGYRKIKGPKNVPILHEKINSYYIRRLKEEVLPDLPDKYYTEIHLELTDKQQKAYDEMRKHMITWLDDGGALTAPVVVAQLQRLQQFACAYAKLTPQGVVLTEPSSKLDALMELIESQSQIVVFSQFRQMCDLLETRLKKKGILYSRITGKVPQFLRQREVDRFQSGENQVFLGTIAAGGEGITLTAASCVAFLDRDWSPSMNSQAEDRLHRMGQENAVQVVDFLARGTVDLGRRAKLEVKREWLRQLLDP
jgi:SNF2 family DNA or RNA helicase